MKRAFSLLLILILLLTFTGLSACKAEAVKKCEQLIADIDISSADYGSKIELAEQCYNGLSEDNRADVENFSLLVAAKEQLTVETLNAFLEGYLNNGYKTAAGKEDTAKYVSEGEYAVSKYSELSEAAKQKISAYNEFNSLYASYKEVYDNAILTAKTYAAALCEYFKLPYANIMQIYCIENKVEGYNYFSFSADYTDSYGNMQTCYMNGLCSTAATSQKLLEAGVAPSMFANTPTKGYDGKVNYNLLFNSEQIFG